MHMQRSDSSIWMTDVGELVNVPLHKGFKRVFYNLILIK